MWIQLLAAFVCSHKAAMFKARLSDFNQSSGEVCVGDTDQDLPYVKQRYGCACVCVTAWVRARVCVLDTEDCLCI